MDTFIGAPFRQSVGRGTYNCTTFSEMMHQTASMLQKLRSHVVQRSVDVSKQML